MKTKDNVQGGEGNMQNAPGKSSLPIGNENDNGVKNGIGIPNAPGHKNNDLNSSGKNTNKKWHFSNERPIL